MTTDKSKLVAEILREYAAKARRRAEKSDSRKTALAATYEAEACEEHAEELDPQTP